MEPLERLLNLVGLLLESRTPLTFEQIRDTLDAYRADNVDSAKRMFERDKDLLRDYGVPLELADVDAWGTEQGYVIRKNEYYLPDISFTPEEVTALFVAAQGGREESAVEQGVRKLLYGAKGGVLTGHAGGPLVAGSDARSDTVVSAAEVAQRHDAVRFGYRTAQGSVSQREIDAYGVVFRGGHWYLVGHDHERDDVRAFRVSRLTTDLVVIGRASKPPPEGFRASDHVQAGPWQSSGDDPAVVAFAPEIAWRAAATFAGAEERGTRQDGRAVVAIPFADERLLASLLLEYGPDAEVLGPPDLRDEIVGRLEALAGA
jgi:proteasome accessory factor B